jgi:hypothetical protein
MFYTGAGILYGKDQQGIQSLAAQKAAAQREADIQKLITEYMRSNLSPSAPASLDNNTVFYGYTDLDPLVSAATGGKYTSIDDPEFMKALINDNAIIRQKYNLPPIELQRNNPGEYVYTLSNQAEQSGIPVVDIRNLEKFVRENPEAGAVYVSGSGSSFGSGPFIAVNPSEDLVAQASVLNHEYIHAMQNVKYPGMPIEVMEYEAYVGQATNPIVRLWGDYRGDWLFGRTINGSSYWYYQQLGTIPSWAINP